MPQCRHFLPAAPPVPEVPAVRPPAAVACEHMFPGATRTARALAALREVANRVAGPGGLLDDVLGDPAPAAHPHRRPLRATRPRRAGTVPVRPQPCLSPLVRFPARDARAPLRAGARRSQSARPG